MDFIIHFENRCFTSFSSRKDANGALRTSRFRTNKPSCGSFCRDARQISTEKAFFRAKNYKITVFAHFVFPVYHTIPLNNYRWLVKSLQILLLFFWMFQYLKNPHFDGKF